ncbi:MAG: hypothetical protein ACIAS6_02560 [Phycisphaerales bacterium JB060]
MTRLPGEGALFPLVTPRDDRGRASRTRVDVEEAAGRMSGGDAGARAKITRRLRSESTTGFGIAMIFVLLFRMSGVEDRVGVPGIAGDAGVIAIALVLFWPVLILMHWRWMGVQRRAALSLGVCPVCGAAIAGLEPEADNRRVCPECGSAWKMDEKAANTDA